MKKSYWNEFFQDVNVHFPKKPKLIDGIGIYDAPYGLGIQFRGGPNNLIIKGKESSMIFGIISQLLDGDNSLEEIFEKVSHLDINNVASILKILHANNLLADGKEKTGIQDSNKISTSQLQFYKRIIGKTGFNKSGDEVLNKIAKSKVLLIGSGHLVFLLLREIQQVGFNNYGVCITQDFELGDALEKEYADSLMAYKKIENESQLYEQLYHSVDDYQSIVVALDNPSDYFIGKINRMSFEFDKPTLYLTRRVNKYEIGPYVVPGASSCYFCYVMRKNSYENDALYQNVYQDDLSEKQATNDNSIEGNDYISAVTSCSYTVSEMIKAATGFASPSLINSVTVYNPLEGRFSHQKILTVPRCPECSKSY